MKTLILTAALAIVATAEALACTSLIATPGATADGSTLATYAADSHTLYGELYSSPAADWPKDAKRVIKEWDTGRILGSIPQVAHTYATMGNMNEHGLTIAESTFGGRSELEDPESLIDYGSLIYITLERARDAREAIRVMTDLVGQYGFCSGGESFTIADPKEAWVMEMVGKGKGAKAPCGWHAACLTATSPVMPTRAASISSLSMTRRHSIPPMSSLLPARRDGLTARMRSSVSPTYIVPLTSALSEDVMRACGLTIISLPTAWSVTSRGSTEGVAR